MFDESGGERIIRDMVDADLHEGLDSFSLQWIGNANGCGFGDGGVRDQRTLDFGGANAVSGNVEDVVGTAENGDVSIFVFHGDVAGNVASREKLPVALVACGVAPDRAQHARERPLEDEASADVWRNRVSVLVDDIGFGAGNRDADLPRTHRHGGRSAECGSTEFGLPPVVDDVSPLAISGEMSLGPSPGFRI